MNLCARCHLPVSGHTHPTTMGCIAALLDELTAMKSAESQEMDRLRKQLAAELALSGAVARLEQWIDADLAHHLFSAGRAGGKWFVNVVDDNESASEHATFAAALTSALDDAEGIA